MDFTVQLSLTIRRHDPIIEAIDTLTKISHFFHARTMHQATDIARVYNNKTFILGDVPK
jgi:hypothetical protein